MGKQVKIVAASNGFAVEMVDSGKVALVAGTVEKAAGYAGKRGWEVIEQPGPAPVAEAIPQAPEAAPAPAAPLAIYTPETAPAASLPLPEATPAGSPDLDTLGRRWKAGEKISLLAKEAGMVWNKLYSKLDALGYNPKPKTAKEKASV